MSDDYLEMKTNSETMGVTIQTEGMTVEIFPMLCEHEGHDAIRMMVLTSEEIPILVFEIDPALAALIGEGLVQSIEMLNLDKELEG